MPCNRLCLKSDTPRFSAALARQPKAGRTPGFCASTPELWTQVEGIPLWRPLNAVSNYLKISQTQGREFALRTVLLDFSRVPHVSAALDYHGYIQLDPLNICGRVHDLMLRNRVVDYQEGDLLRFIHGQSKQAAAQNLPRGGFEHYIPGAGILAAWPLSAYPYVKAYLERIHPSVTRSPFSQPEEILAHKILSEITERGPLMSDDFTHEGRAQTAWGSYGRLTKIVLEKLFAAGKILITERRGFRRVYDLATRVIPSRNLESLPGDKELHRWRALLPLQQRRLVNLRRRDVTELGDLLQPVEIEGKLLVYCLRKDIHLLESPHHHLQTDLCELLSPLDPLIYDRKLTRALWDFDFTWEVYTPASVRKRGYYSLPLLAGLELVGDIEPKADRKTRRLQIISRRVKRGYKTARATEQLATFLGLR